MLSIHFSTRDVARFTGLSIRQLNYWAQHGIFVPSVKNSHGPGTRKFYSVDDVIQLRSLRKLRCFRWSTLRIKEAITTLREVMTDANPLKRAMVFGGEKNIFIVCKTEAGERIFFEALGSGQQQILGIVLETLEEETKQLIGQFFNEK